MQKLKLKTSARLDPLIFVLLLFAVGFLPAVRAAENFAISWTNNILKVTGNDLPGGTLEILYLEAFCRSNSTHRNWNETKISHRTTLLESSPSQLRFRTTVSNQVQVSHEVIARGRDLEFTYRFENVSDQPIDLEWFQPACIRVAAFTGADQQGYTARSFIFATNGLRTLDKTARTLEAIYRGGQVYVPERIAWDNVNPRPPSSTRPVNGLIGCFSADHKWLLATASDDTHELFEGVYVCLHSDPHVGGLRPGEKKSFRAKLYVLPNDVEKLLQAYYRDFPRTDEPRF